MCRVKGSEGRRCVGRPAAAVDFEGCFAAVDSGSCMVGRRRGFVDGVFWSFERRRFGGIVGRVGVDGASGESGESGEKAAAAGGGNNTAAGAIPVVKGVWDMGDASGDCREGERDWTYECLRSGRFVISSFAASSWWTAMLNRRQKLGSRTMVVVDLDSWIRLLMCSGAC